MSKSYGKLEVFFNHQLHHQLPVAVYRLPGKKQIHVIAQTSRAERKLKSVSVIKNAVGFLFAPFQATEDSPLVFIDADLHTTANKLPDMPAVNLNTKHTPVQSTIKDTDKKQFIQQVKDCIDAIHANCFSKIVTARVKRVRKNNAFSPITFFKQLCSAYPQAFVSVVFSKTTGIWVGATPEVLLQNRNKKFITFSLAGTKRSKKQQWSTKELEEQAFVTKYIENIIKKRSGKRPLISKLQTTKAGHLFHLRNTISWNAANKNDWYVWAKRLHPTPAVAGMPAKSAVKYIMAHEPNPRKYYSGYLGPVNCSKEVNLYVNLRCMYVGQKNLELYAGCGVTSLSNAEAEWEETNNKLNTLLNILQNGKKP